MTLLPREMLWLCRSTRLGFEPLNQCFLPLTCWWELAEGLELVSSMQMGELTDPLPKGACKQLPEGSESLGKM